MKYLLLLIIGWLAGVAVTAGDTVLVRDRKAPVPPSQVSKIGYLTVTGDNIEIVPKYKRTFISPRTTLPVLENLDDSFLFLISREIGRAHV